jgi:hypothetical protein
MLINCAGSNVQLYGVQSKLLELSVVEVLLINEVEATYGYECLVQSMLPEPIQQLLNEFDCLFTEP